MSFLPSCVDLLQLRIDKSCPQAPVIGAAIQAWGENPEASGNALFYRLESGYLVRVVGIADFVLRHDGSGATCFPVLDADASWQAIYSQQIVPLLLSLQGARVFHGGAIAVEDRAIAFLGPSGSGKSTLTASFAARGIPFLTDDCLCLSEENPPFALPNVDYIRVWHDSAHVIAPGAIDHTQAKPCIHSDTRLLPKRDFPTQLAAAFLLDYAENEEVESSLLTPATAAMAWVSNMFTVDLTSARSHRRNIEFAARVAVGVPTYRLVYPRDYARLEDVVSHIISRIEHVPAGQASRTLI